MSPQTSVADPSPRPSLIRRIKERTKGLFRKYGWKLGLAIFVGYLIRDVTLYIVIPYLVARKLID